MSDERKKRIYQFFFLYLHTSSTHNDTTHTFLRKKSHRCAQTDIACLFLIPHLTTLSNILSLRKKQRFSSRVTCFPVVHASSHKDTFVSFELQLISLL